MHLNNPREPTAKATLWMSWQGTLSEACSQDPLPGLLHLVLTLCLCALAHLGPWPPTWMVAFGFQQNRAVVKKPFGCLTPFTGWIHPGIIAHQKLFIFFIFYWLHGKSCKYRLLSFWKLRRNVNVVLVHSRLNSFERKTKHVSHPVIKSFLQCVWRDSLFCRNKKWKRSVAHSPTDVGCSYPLVGSEQQEGCLLTSPRTEISASTVNLNHF